MTSNGKPNLLRLNSKDQPPATHLVTFSGKTLKRSLERYYPIVGTATFKDQYQFLEKIGQGTYGIVSRYRNLKNNEIIAIKKVKIEDDNKDGLPISSLREITLLKNLNHPNIVKLNEIMVGRRLDDVNLVMEFCDQDLAIILDHTETKFSPETAKGLFLQFLRGLKYCHHRQIIHRDLKLSNLLLTQDGILKIGKFIFKKSFDILLTIYTADWGMGRKYHPIDSNGNLTPRICTLWYRAPELMFSDQPNYDAAVDMWSAGCILAEFLLKRPIFPGRTDVDQVNLMVKLLGSPHEGIWNDFHTYKYHDSFPTIYNEYNTLDELFPEASEATLHLLYGLLTYDPKLRMTVEEAFYHPYFIEDPQPLPPNQLQKFPDFRKKLGTIHLHRSKLYCAPLEPVNNTQNNLQPQEEKEQNPVINNNENNNINANSNNVQQVSNQVAEDPTNAPVNNA
ncbi:Pkinase-domain-containing protein [Conidiobolus coronatus NRRL 28638]|uniref:cyclin-dependent kinase n=1 Tax=Conidiobolus coronatus (strain ATCC 28846 / CBS 209.66 / NRRL 28638) TaxID=796925 RepID=A0A137NX92_CONC2|nr:Pkinase-domain-containing protein [Conidiobolus coronatus NRRL 28638]|eukprot:KXN67347.1 Pkinase-domain-containing protein [Conidiobolus coronatus NRRL 28638]